MNRLRRFILNGILMATVTILMRSVTVSFNVYVANKIGAVAMGVFSLITNVYAFGVTFATSGINLATTRLVAEVAEVETPDDKRANGGANARAILTRCVAYSFIFGISATAILFMLSSKISIVILRDERCIEPLKILSLSLLPISMCSALSGYFTAIRRVYKNAVTQICGQAVRIFLTVYLLATLGASDTYSACISLALGATVSELASLILQIFLYLTEKKNKNTVSATKVQKKHYTKKLIANALPVALSTYMRSALVTVEHILIPIGLEKSGNSRDTSLAAYGVVGSMVFPLILFPAAISASFAGLLIPEIAESCAANDRKRISGIINTVIETVLIFSIGCAGIMICFSLRLGATLYPNEASAGKYILMLAPLIPVMYIDTAIDSMLKGIGEQVYSMWVNIADALISVIFVAMLLPRFGIFGYIITVYFTEILNATLSISRLLIKCDVKTHVLKWVLRPLTCIVLSTKICNILLESLFPELNVWICISLTVLSYILLLIAFKAIKVGRILNRIKYMIEYK